MTAPPLVGSRRPLGLAPRKKALLQITWLIRGKLSWAGAGHCAYPKYAYYKGQGDPEDARNFEGRERAGMAILDVGRGTRAITADIAKAVRPSGVVLGIDRDDANLAIGFWEHRGIGNLRFEGVDILTLDVENRFHASFDIRLQRVRYDLTLGPSSATPAVLPSVLQLVPHSFIRVHLGRELLQTVSSLASGDS